jgi:hypothetical protein
MAYPSLFSREEQTSSRDITHESKSIQKEGDIFLSGLIFFDDQNWCLWINNKIVTSETKVEIGHYHLEKVTSHYAEFSYVSSQSTEKKSFKLRPQQVYRSREEKVVAEMKN